jgi:large subunit ribosomal protein L10
MKRDEKAAVVDEIAEQIGSAEALYAVDYRGITVSQIADLRAKLRDADTSLRIVKNSLTELAADKAGASELKELLEGPTALALVRGDAALAAKALSDTARQLHILEFKGGLMNGGTLSAAEIQSIARLPSRDVLNAQLVGTIAAPLTGLVRTLNALITGLAIQLQAIADLDPPALVRGETPAPVAEPEPQPEAEAAAEPEPEAAAEPEAEAAPEPEAEAAAEPEPEAAAEPEPEAAAEPEPGAAAEPEPEPEAAAEAAAEPEPEAEVESAATEPEQDAASDADESDA